MTAPVVLGLFLVFVLSQTSLLAKAGVTSHTTLQKFADTIHKDKQGEATIGVGSYDIHEKEFQVHFDQKVIKAGASFDGETRWRLGMLFKGSKKVYCLISKKDYDKFLSIYQPDERQIIQSEYMVRKRFHIDKKFFEALLTFDRDTVWSYLLEEVVLVKKEAHV